MKFILLEKRQGFGHANFVNTVIGRDTRENKGDKVRKLAAQLTSM